MFIPLKDDNPTRSFPFMNLALILVNAGVFLYMGTLPERAHEAFLLANAEIPRHVAQFLAGRLSFEVAFRPLITSMFLHGGWMHILGNMLFLYIFGDNIEDYFGHLGYLLFYFVCGIGAGLIHIVFNLNSMVPALGASGAISGVMGAYAVLYPRNRILTLVFIFLVPIPAIFILGYWFLLQFLEGVGWLGLGAQGGVAWWAHIGGFLLGVVITLMVRTGTRGPRS
jgi:membrane associated rhomboid family serine protease